MCSDEVSYFLWNVFKNDEVIDKSDVLAVAPGPLSVLAVAPSPLSVLAVAPGPLSVLAVAPGPLSVLAAVLVPLAHPSCSARSLVCSSRSACPPSPS